MLAWLDSTSMLCARVVRGAASSAKLVSPAAARRARLSLSKGLSMPTRWVPGFISASSSTLGLLTFSTSSQAKAASRLTISAPTAA
jgi:hypothetical protein